jgi:hypothetical protein
MSIISRIKEINNRLGYKTELRPGNVSKIINANYFETYENIRKFHTA